MLRGRRVALILGFCCLPARPLQIRTERLPWAIVGQPYYSQVDIVLNDACLKADVQLALLAGRLPEGLALVGSGLEGTPRETGRFRFTLRAANGCIAAEKNVELFVTGRPVLQVSPGELAFEYQTGGALPQPQVALAAGTWPNLPYWVIVEGATWLHAEPVNGVTPDTGSAFSGDRVIVRVDPEKLAPGIYKTSITFSTWLGANHPEIPVTLKVVNEH